jgi:DNA-binding HxlR family transcriptional regulator
VETLNTLKELERSGTVPIILALSQLGKGKFTDIHYESIWMGFRVGSGVVSRRLDQLCALGWVQKKNEEGSKVFTLTEKGLGLAKAIKEFTRSLEKNKVE